MKVSRGISDFRATLSDATITLILSVALLAAAEPGIADATKGRVVHVVLMWLKEPDNEEHRSRIVEATREFADLPGIEEIRVGGPISPDPSSTHGGFDVGLYMIFSSVEALDAYQTHPAHRQARKSILEPLVERVVVYDFLDDPG